MSDPYVGKVVAERFKITSRIGEGGMGLVYFADDLATKSSAAIKFLHRHLISNEEFLARFRQEARTASQFRHENAVRILDAGDDEDGVPFIAMDFCPGRSLRALIDESAPFPPDRACRIGEKILRALSEAHKHGIIHRDLKPDNIKVEADGSDNELVKVLDFGVAKFIGSEDMQEMSGAVKTATGVVFGTPKYMAPEQIMGEGVDSRSDLYAVGAILYEMLSGSPTFETSDMMEFVTKFLHQPVPPLHERIPKSSLPVGLERLVMELLEKERGARPSKAEEVADALSEFAQGRIAREMEADSVKKVHVTRVLFLVAAVLGVAGAVAAALLPGNFWHLNELNMKGFCRMYPFVPAAALTAIALGVGSFAAFSLFPRVGEAAFLIRTLIVGVSLAAAGLVLWIASGSLLEDTQKAWVAKWAFSFPLAGGLVFVFFSLGWGVRRRFLAFLLGGILAALLGGLLQPLPHGGGMSGVWDIKPLGLEPLRPALAIALVAFAYGLCGLLSPRAMLKARR